MQYQLVAPKEPLRGTQRGGGESPVWETLLQTISVVFIATSTAPLQICKHFFSLQLEDRRLYCLQAPGEKLFYKSLKSKKNLKK